MDHTGWMRSVKVGHAGFGPAPFEALLGGEAAFSYI
jgi:hypothetical protein